MSPPDDKDPQAPHRAKVRQEHSNADRTTKLGSSGLELGVSDEELFSSPAPLPQQGALDEDEFDPSSVAPAGLGLLGVAAGEQRSPPVGLQQSEPPDAQATDDLSLSLVPGAGPTFDIPALMPEGLAPKAPAIDKASGVNEASTPSLDGALDVPSLTPAPKKAQAVTGHDARSAAASPSPALQTSGQVGMDLGALPGMGNEVDLGGGLDDLEFGGAADAQLNMAVPVAEKEDDVPWPTGRTPYSDELTIELEEVQSASGFGPAPERSWHAPMYAVRVFLALRSLKEKDDASANRLSELERARDEKLMELAESKRTELSAKERFTALYANIDRHDEKIVQMRAALETADVEGAQVLRDVQAKIDGLVGQRSERQNVRDERRADFDEAQRAVQRITAALKRIDIEWRNIEQRAAKLPGDEMPDDLNAQLDVLEAQREKAKKELEPLKTRCRQLQRLFKDAENSLSIIVADAQRGEGEKEALLMAYEGDIAIHSRKLDEAVLARQDELASAGRAILELRGEVRVGADTRSNLLVADEAVARAAMQRETMKQALASMNQESYDLGKAVWGGAILAILVLIVLFAIL